MTRLFRHCLVAAGLLLVTACGSPPPVAPPPVAPAPADPELVFWESVRDSKDVAEYYAYLQAYPAGRFSALARIRIDALTPKPAPKAATPAPPRAKPPTPKVQALPPSHQQGEPTITEAPAPPVNWAKIDDLSGRANPLLRSQIMDCWTPPPLPTGAGSYRAEVGIYFDPATGQVRGAAFLGGNREMTDATFARFVNSALAAPMDPACRSLDLRQAGIGQGTATTGLVLLFALDSPP
ncbi:hypothetical protein [Niveispirillum lacus]|uniref:hypothetical protein n=1 Tax=Niveispirillum lacus TaxID=1981099 RepID=UPI0010566B4A|nr:hypothetical protein [Niveispirillum lacus]